jgi:hypothetical protein
MDLWFLFEEARQAVPHPVKTALAAAAGAVFGAWLTSRSRTKGNRRRIKGNSNGVCCGSDDLQ